jgi:hypothetical protein
VLAAVHDDREVLPATHTSYLGAELDVGDRSLLPDLVIADMTLDRWLARQHFGVVSTAP